VWAKWQSSTALGDGVGAIVKGNRQPGNGMVIARESLLDLKPQCLPDLLPLTPVFLIVIGEGDGARIGKNDEKRRG